jgi:hypothetical protein
MLYHPIQQPQACNYQKDNTNPNQCVPTARLLDCCAVDSANAELIVTPLAPPSHLTRYCSTAALTALACKVQPIPLANRVI